MTLEELQLSLPPITILIILGLLIFNFGVIIYLVITGWGIWKLQERARLAAIIIALVLGSYSLVNFLATISRGNFVIPYVLILNILILTILFRKDVKSAFNNAKRKGKGIKVTF